MNRFLTRILILFFSFFFFLISSNIIAQTSFSISSKTTGDTLLTIDNSGKMGLGIRIPVARLDLLSTGSGFWQRGIRLLNPDLGRGNQLMLVMGKYDNVNNAANVYFSYNGDGSVNNRLSMGLSDVNDVLNILASGRTGIGTINPQAKLDLRGAFRISAAIDLPSQTNDGLFMGGYYNDTDIGRIYVGDKSGWKFHFSSRINDTDTDLLTIQDNGNVGIGITNPNDKLQINGTVYSTSGGFRFPDGSLQTTAAGDGKWSGDPDIYYNGGRVGIGTATPGAGLHLKSTGFPNSFLYLESAADNDAGIRLYEGETPQWHLFNNTVLNGFQIYNSGGTNTVFFADQSSGNIGIGTTSPGIDKFVVAGTVYSTEGGFKFPDGTTQTTAAIGGGTGNTLDQAYDTGGPGAGRTITADAGAVTIAGVDGFLSTGTTGSGTIPVEGSGTRMMWYPGKAAFRAGRAWNDTWNDENIGSCSFALGDNNVARGTYSTAFGYGMHVNGHQSFGISLSNSDIFNLNSNNVMAILGGRVGIGTVIPSADFHVEGLNGVLFKGGLLGFGTIPEAGAGVRMMWYPAKGSFRAGGVTGSVWDQLNTGDYSFATGFNTQASGNFSVAIGYSASATGLYSTAIGNSTQATGSNSTAMGSSTNAQGTSSTAFGAGSHARNECTVAMGYDSRAYANYSTAMGYNTLASGISSTTMGRCTAASGATSTAMGWYTEAIGDFSTAIGYATRANGLNSFAMGRSIQAVGDYSVAIALSDQSNLQVTQNNTMAVMGGSVGIGQASPLTKLHVKNLDIALPAAALTNDMILVENADAVFGLYSNNSGNYGSAFGMGEIVSGALTNKWSLYRTTSIANPANQLRFSFGTNSNYAANTPMMVISENGNIGIGTTAPTQRLEVAGVIHSTSGGFRFPDGTVQESAAGPGGGEASIDNLIDGKSDETTVFLGSGAGETDDGDNNNTAVGIEALNSNTDGNGNTSFGYQSLYSNTNGVANIANGFQALYFNTTGDSNIACGYEALSGRHTGHEGISNIAYGKRSLYSNSDGDYNIAIGSMALLNNYGGGYHPSGPWEYKDGSYNIAIGKDVMRNNQFGAHNIAAGYQALYLNTGYGSERERGDYNIALGYQSLFNTNGGTGSLAMIASYNTGIGHEVLYNNATGNGNNALGYQAGITLLDGDYNTFIGHGADAASGSLDNATAIGYNAEVDASNKVRIGNTSVTVIEGQVDFTYTSDKNKKENFLDIDGEQVLQKIRQFNIQSWNYIHDPAMIRHYGPVSQEFFNAFGDDGLGPVGSDTTLCGSDVNGINMIAIQALEKRSTEQAGKLEASVQENIRLCERIAALEKEKNSLNEKLGQLEEQIQNLQDTLLKMANNYRSGQSELSCRNVSR